MILRHERFERNHRLGARIKRMFSLHGSAHPYERLGGESDANPQRHQAGLPNQDDNTAAMIAIQIETRPTFSTRPMPLLRQLWRSENSSPRLVWHSMVFPAEETLHQTTDIG